MSKDTYTNRHGKTIVVDEPTKIPQQTEASASKSVKIHTTKPSFASRLHFPQRSYTKVIFIVLAIIIVGAFAGLLFMTQSNATQYNATIQQMKQNISQASSLKVPTNTELSATVSTLSGKLPDISCPKLVIWFDLTESARDARQRCSTMQAGYQATRAHLATLATVATYNQQLIKTLNTSLTNPSDGAFAQVQSYADSWRNAAESLKKMSPPPVISKANTAVITAVGAVADAWQKLAEADTAKDAAAFGTAKESLSVAYTALHDTSDQLIADMLPLQKQLSTDISRLQ